MEAGPETATVMPRVGEGLRRMYRHPGVSRLRQTLRDNPAAHRVVDRLLAIAPAGRLLGSLRQETPDPPSFGAFDVATRDDLRYCYRLLLRRDPDPAGWDFWAANIDKGRISLTALTTSFLGCEEFLGSQRGAAAGPRADPKATRLVELGEFSLYVHDNDHAIGAPLAATKVYEPHVVRALRPLLRDGSVFVDVGANIGYFTLLAASLVGPDGRVVAVEPNPANCELLRRSVEHNNLANVEVHCKAASDHPQTYVLEVDGSNGRVLALQPTVDPGAVPASFVVDGVTMDDLLADATRIDVVKIDIEGAEPIALRGMSQTLRRHRPMVITEFFPAAIEGTSETEPVAYLASLRALGYELFVVGEDGVSDVAQDDAQVFEALAASGSDHLDLLARPAT